MHLLTSGFIGGLIAIMVVFNGMLSSAFGNNYSLLIIHLTGLIGIIGILFFTRTKIIFNKHIPLYLYSAGFIGIITVTCNNIAFTHLGSSIPLALGLLGQSIASLVIDHYGLFGLPKIPIEPKKMIGLSLVTLGIIVMCF